MRRRDHTSDVANRCYGTTRVRDVQENTFLPSAISRTCRTPAAGSHRAIRDMIRLPRVLAQASLWYGIRHTIGCVLECTVGEATAVGGRTVIADDGRLRPSRYFAIKALAASRPPCLASGSRRWHRVRIGLQLSARVRNQKFLSGGNGDAESCGVLCTGSVLLRGLRWSVGT